ncbi:DUF1878 family protein [Ornithinibacillus halotolerans]|uniref:DUF1878 family protein n=1 Tax=Ornithinibacillus halotolerans TaxID=1274357 RepID=A0A916W6X3_9BACI|nr:DUF1878 family protein [Ornithinibacillus halotolerans]GGA73450.1 hypothetical protein GCM10008025_16440 [Ornithinibacillus halotolerans]
MSELNNLTLFQLQLLTKIIDINKYPFTKLVIEHQLTQEEYNELFSTLEQLNGEYQEQIEEGLLDYSSHLVRFVGSLSDKLEPTETVYALHQEGFYPDLLSEFIKIIKKDGL